MILEGIQRQVRLEEQCGEVKYYLEEADVYHNALQRSSDIMFRQREEEDLQTWEEVPVLLRSATTKVHRQYSHSLYKENFSRHLKLSAAPDRAIKAASLFTCPTCEKERRSPARPMAAVPNHDHFNQCMAMDIAHIPDQDDVMHFCSWWTWQPHTLLLPICAQVRLLVDPRSHTRHSATSRWLIGCKSSEAQTKYK